MNIKSGYVISAIALVVLLSALAAYVVHMKQLYSSAHKTKTVMSPFNSKTGTPPGPPPNGSMGGNSFDGKTGAPPGPPPDGQFGGGSFDGKTGASPGPPPDGKFGSNNFDGRSGTPPGPPPKGSPPPAQ